jgi:hypothetical protein
MQKFYPVESVLLVTKRIEFGSTAAFGTCLLTDEYEEFLKRTWQRVNISDSISDAGGIC